MRLNLNDNIRVKLTEHGKDIYYHQYDRTNKLLGREVCKPSYPEVDEDGYTTFQLWCFIELYGIHIGMTLPNVIEPLDIVFDAPAIEPETEEEAYERGYTAGQMAGLRKKGKWIWKTWSNYQCSECSHVTNVDECMEEPMYNYCPYCGADMRGEQE